MKKSLTLLLAALLFAASVAGCAPELYERALISAVGVDKTEDGCRVTVRAAQADAGGTEISLSGEGKTVPEALNEITRVTGQQPLYSHNTLVVFGMDCAQDGLKEYLDFFLRHYDSRPTVKVFLSETTAEDILRVESAEEPRAEQIAELAKSADYSGLSADSTARMGKALPPSFPSCAGMNALSRRARRFCTTFRCGTRFPPRSCRGFCSCRARCAPDSSSSPIRNAAT